MKNRPRVIAVRKNVNRHGVYSEAFVNRRIKSMSYRELLNITRAVNSCSAVAADVEVHKLSEEENGIATYIIKRQRNKITKPLGDKLVLNVNKQLLRVNNREVGTIDVSKQIKFLRKIHKW